MRSRRTSGFLRASVAIAEILLTLTRNSFARSASGSQSRITLLAISSRYSVVILALCLPLLLRPTGVSVFCALLMALSRRVR